VKKRRILGAPAPCFASLCFKKMKNSSMIQIILVSEMSQYFKGNSITQVGKKVGILINFEKLEFGMEGNIGSSY
jgi:hypothetical protein